MPQVQMTRGPRSMTQYQHVRLAQMAGPITDTPAPVAHQHATMQATMMPPMSAMIQVHAQSKSYKLCAPAQSASGETIAQVSHRVLYQFFLVQPLFKTGQNLFLV